MGGVLQPMGAILELACAVLKPTVAILKPLAKAESRRLEPGVKLKAGGNGARREAEGWGPEAKGRCLSLAGWSAMNRLVGHRLRGSAACSES